MQQRDGSTLRVLQVIKSLGRGGAETLLLTLHRPLRELGIECEYVFFLPWKDALVEELRREGGRVHLLPARTSPGVVLGARRLARLIRRRDYGLVHCHLPLSGVAGRIAGRLTRTPVVYTEHNLQDRYVSVTRRLNAWTWGWQKQVIAVSEEVGRSISSSIGGRVPVRVIANGVDTSVHAPNPASRESTRHELGVTSDETLIGSVAVFRTQKRLDRWLEAAALLAREWPQCRFLLVGDGSEMGRVLEWADDLGIRPKLHLPGLCEDVRPYLNAMDLYLLSSDFEGLPVAVLEAMASEVPVVSTRVGGVPQAVEDGTNGLLVRSSTPEALASACARLVADAALRRRLGEASRRTVETRFSIDRMARDLQETYREILATQGRPR